MARNSEKVWDPCTQAEFNEAVRQVSSVMKERARKGQPKALVRTYGCQQNVSDGEKIKGILLQMGFSFTSQEEEADLILFNTCAVREHAEDRVFGNVGALKNLKKRHPSTLIVLCGCMMEQQHVVKKIRESYPFVGLVFGTNALHRFPQMLLQALRQGRLLEHGGETEEIIEGLPVHRDGRFQAWIPIMYGCNNFCSYCIVPYVRGRERSRNPAAVLQEAESLISDGYKEITLLGQNVNSYGKTLQAPSNFAALLREVDQIPGDYWIRFMTSHPKDATRELIDTMAQGRHIAGHLHLPFQSGNNRVLRAMNRGYTREQYLETIRYAKERIPGLSITSDVIVGFPGETREEFLDTLSLIKEVEFTSLFTFIFSPRMGTPAAQMPDPVSHEEKVAWFQELTRTQEQISSKRCASLVGEVVRVLVEKEEAPGVLHGRTAGNWIVQFAGGVELLGRFINVKITKARNWILHGEWVQ